MEATAMASTTGSQTIADLVPRAAVQHAERRRRALQARRRLARRHLRPAGGDRAGDRPRADRPRHLSPASASASSPTPARSGPTWTWPRPPPGAWSVPIYPTNSPEECLWVISDSGACAIVCENEEQLAKIAAIRDAAAGPAHGHRDRPARAELASGGSRITRRARDDHARGGARARPRAVRRRARSAPRGRATRGSVHVHLHLRHDRPAEGLRAHARQLPRDHRHDRRGRRDQRRRGHLPVSAARALLRAADPAARRSTSAARSPTSAATPSRSSPSCSEVKPTYLPSVPRVFEKIYTLAHGAIEAQPPEEQERARADDRARGEGARHDQPRRSGPRGAAGAVRGSRRAAVQERARDLRRRACATRPAARRRSRARSSSSSGPAACRCSRATA